MVGLVVPVRLRDVPSHHPCLFDLSERRLAHKSDGLLCGSPTIIAFRNTFWGRGLYKGSQLTGYTSLCSTYVVPLISNASHLDAKLRCQRTVFCLRDYACVPLLEEVLSPLRSFASLRRRNLLGEARWRLAL